MWKVTHESITSWLQRSPTWHYSHRQGRVLTIFKSLTITWNKLNQNCERTTSNCSPFKDAWQKCNRNVCRQGIFVSMLDHYAFRYLPRWVFDCWIRFLIELGSQILYVVLYEIPFPLVWLFSQLPLSLYGYPFRVESEKNPKTSSSMRCSLSLTPPLKTPSTQVVNLICTTFEGCDFRSSTVLNCWGFST